MFFWSYMLLLEPHALLTPVFMHSSGLNPVMYEMYKMYNDSLHYL